MSRHEIGIDLVDIHRIRTVLGRFPDRFRLRVLTDHEQAYCGRRTSASRVDGRPRRPSARCSVSGSGASAGERSRSSRTGPVRLRSTSMSAPLAAPRHSTSTRSASRSRTSARWRSPSPWRTDVTSDGSGTGVSSSDGAQPHPALGRDASAGTTGPVSQGRFRPPADRRGLDRLSRCRGAHGTGSHARGRRAGSRRRGPVRGGTSGRSRARGDLERPR